MAAKIEVETLADKMPLLTKVAAYARLHELEAKRSGGSIRFGIIIPLSEDERKEFDRLMRWWSSFGPENKSKLIDLVYEMSQHVKKSGGMG